MGRLRHAAMSVHSRRLMDNLATFDTLSGSSLDRHVDRLTATWMALEPDLLDATFNPERPECLARATDQGWRLLQAHPKGPDETKDQSWTCLEGLCVGLARVAKLSIR